MTMLRALIAMMAVAFLAACGADHAWAPDSEVEAARYVAGPPAALTLITVVNDRNGHGAHAALLINASERVLFDPAGTWHMPGVPIRNDVHFGMTDRAITFYRDYHARDRDPEHFHVVEQRIEVPPQIAEQAFRNAKAYGAVPKAYCANAISTILRDVPGFENLPATFFPNKLSAAFGQLPGVTEQVFTHENANPGGDYGIILLDKKGKRVN